jgi:hypothetical protein
MHMEEIENIKVPSFEDVLKEYEVVFGELLRLPPMRDIEFSIDLMPGAALVSNIPYRTSTIELK